MCSTRWRSILRSRLAVGSLFIVVFALAGCGGENMCMCGGQAPNWYLNTPNDPEYVYAANTGTSPKMQAAIDTAIIAARKDLAESFDVKMESETRAIADSLEGQRQRHFVQARSEAVRAVSGEASPRQKEVYEQDNGRWRAFVLMEVPVSEAAQTLLSALEEHPNLHDAFQSSPPYRRMTVGTAQAEGAGQE